MKTAIIINCVMLVLCLINVNLPWRVSPLIWLNKAYAVVVLMVVCCVASVRLYLESGTVPDGDAITYRVFTRNPKEIRRRSIYVNLFSWLMYTVLIIFLTP